MTETKNPMKELVPYMVEASAWRFGMRSDGVAYVVTQDVAETLEYARASDAVYVLDSEEYGTEKVRTIDSRGRAVTRDMLVIYEDGILELLFLSRKEGAKLLKKRVKAILKEIRDTGAYISDDLDIARLARIKEMMDYKVLRAMVAQSIDYDSNNDYTRRIYAMIQNRYLVAVSGMNKDQLIASREIVTWTGKTGPTKRDQETGKNYLIKDELESLGAHVAVTVAMMWRDYRNTEYTMDQFMNLVGVSLAK